MVRAKGAPLYLVASSLTAFFLTTRVVALGGVLPFHLWPVGIVFLEQFAYADHGKTIATGQFSKLAAQEVMPHTTP